MQQLVSHRPEQMQLGAVAVLAVALLQVLAVTPLEGARAPRHEHPCQRVVAQAPHPCPPVAQQAGTVSAVHAVAQGRRHSERQAAAAAAAVARVVKTKLAAVATAVVVIVVRVRQQQLP